MFIIILSLSCDHHLLGFSYGVASWIRFASSRRSFVREEAFNAGSCRRPRRDSLSDEDKEEIESRRRGEHAGFAISSLRMVVFIAADPFNRTSRRDARSALAIGAVQNSSSHLGLPTSESSKKSSIGHKKISLSPSGKSPLDLRASRAS